MYARSLCCCLLSVFYLFFSLLSAFVSVLDVGGMDRGDDGEGGTVFLDDAVFIQGLPESVTEERLAEHFAHAGTIKVSLHFWAFTLCVVSTPAIACLD